MHTYWIILILTLISTLIPTLNVPIYKFQYQCMFCVIFKQISICMIIMVQITTCMINHVQIIHLSKVIMQILYSYSNTCILHAYNTVMFLIDNSKYTNIKRNLNVKCIKSLHLLLYCLKMLYIVNEKRGIQSKNRTRTWNN